VTATDPAGVVGTNDDMPHIVPFLDAVVAAGQ
jgi:hypothetical protein